MEVKALPRDISHRDICTLRHARSCLLSNMNHQKTYTIVFSHLQRQCDTRRHATTRNPFSALIHPSFIFHHIVHHLRLVYPQDTIAAVTHLSSRLHRANPSQLPQHISYPLEKILSFEKHRKYRERSHTPSRIPPFPQPPIPSPPYRLPTTLLSAQSYGSHHPIHLSTPHQNFGQPPVDPPVGFPQLWPLPITENTRQSESPRLGRGRGGALSVCEVELFVDDEEEEEVVVVVVLDFIEDEEECGILGGC